MGSLDPIYLFKKNKWSMDDKQEEKEEKEVLVVTKREKKRERVTTIYSLVDRGLLLWNRKRDCCEKEKGMGKKKKEVKEEKKQKWGGLKSYFDVQVYMQKLPLIFFLL